QVAAPHRDHVRQNRMFCRKQPPRYKSRLAEEHGNLLHNKEHRQDGRNFPECSKWPVVSPSSANPEKSCSSCLRRILFAVELILPLRQCGLPLFSPTLHQSPWPSLRG